LEYLEGKELPGVSVLDDDLLAGSSGGTE